MGKQIFDKYSYLHFSVGIILYFWKVSFINAVLLHTFYEVFIDNTDFGAKFINKIKIWPGGKKSRDTPQNSFGDTIFFIIGYLSAQYIDYISENKFQN